MEINKFKIAIFLMLLSVVEIHAQGKTIFDTIVLKIDYSSYEKQAFKHFSKSYEITKKCSELDKNENLLIPLSDIYKIDSLKLFVIPVFKLNDIKSYSENLNAIKLIDFDQNFFQQIVFIENNNVIVSFFDLNGIEITEKDYIENYPSEKNYYTSIYELVLMSNFFDFIPGGGPPNYFILKQYYKDYINFYVKGFEGTFIVENGILFYIRSFINDHMNIQKLSIELNNIKIPDEIEFIKIEFNTYMKNMFSDKEMKQFFKSGELNEKLTKRKIKKLRKLSKKNVFDYRLKVIEDKK